jgi:hypothetical protein
VLRDDPQQDALALAADEDRSVEPRPHDLQRFLEVAEALSDRRIESNPSRSAAWATDTIRSKSRPGRSSRHPCGTTSP